MIYNYSSITEELCPEEINLTDKKTGKVISFQKNIVHVGRSVGCDIDFDKEYRYVARMQATFFCENGKWYLQDNCSTNGTYVNGKRLDSGERYLLEPGDEIDFAHSAVFIYEQTIEKKEMPQEEPQQIEEGSKELAILEAAIQAFAQADYTGNELLRMIFLALLRAPLYFPVDIDMEALFGNINPEDLKSGEYIKPDKDVKMKFLTLTVKEGETFIPAFTSREEAQKGESASVIRLYPQDYLPMVLPMENDMVINPFGTAHFILGHQVIKEALVPLILKTESPEELKNKMLKNSPELKNILKGEINGNSSNLHGNSNSEPKEPKDAWNDFIGKVIDGRYEIIKKCDSFQNVATFLAIDMRLPKQWKIKVCNLKGDSNAVIGQALIKEAYMLKQLEHPGIPRMIDMIKTEDYLYIVTDYLDGIFLEDIVQQEGPQSPEHVIDWAKQVCEILSYLHNRKPALIHRDIKPRNLLLRPEGNVMLIEFDIMREYNPKKMADTCCLGTKGYAAPEQFGTMGQTDARTDIYALGVTMYYLLTGKNPCDPTFALVPVRQLNPAIPEGLELIIEKCTKNNPLERYQNCEELLKELEDWNKPVKKQGLFGKLFSKK